jgi:hypothetical protein
MTQKEMYDRILKASEQIAKMERNKANYIIVSPKIAEALENLDIRKHRRKKLEAIFKSQENDKTS